MKLNEHNSATADTLVSWDCDMHGIMMPVKNNFDGLEGILDSPCSDGNLAELKPLPPFDYMTNNIDPMLCNNNNHLHMDETSLYKTTTLQAYPSTSDVVSSSGNVSSSDIKHDGYLVSLGADVVNDEFAAIIGHAMCADSTVNSDPVSALDSTDIPSDWSDIQLDDWIEKVCSPGLKGANTVESLSSSLNPNILVSHHNYTTYISSPSSSVISSSSNNNNNLISSSVNCNPPNSNMHSLLVHNNSHVKRENNYNCMPILQARLQNSPLDTMPKPETTYMKAETTYMKAESTFNNSCSMSKDSMPHTTNPCSASVVTSGSMGGFGFHRRPFSRQSPMKELDTSDLLASKQKSKYRFGKSNKLMPPILTDGTKEKPIHRCGVCNRGFLNKSNIKVHLRTHTGEKPFKCDTCGKSFRQKAHLIKHNHIHKRSTRD